MFIYFSYQIPFLKIFFDDKASFGVVRFEQVEKLLKMDSNFYGWCEDILAKKKKNKTGYPDFVIDSLARALLPSIQQYFETKQGKEEFKKWKKEQLNKNPSKK